jgi:hypothetical protein
MTVSHKIVLRGWQRAPLTRTQTDRTSVEQDRGTCPPHLPRVQARKTRARRPGGTPARA